MMMGVMLMGSVPMAFPAMSQVMTGHRGTNSGQSSGMGAPVVERKSSNRSMMGMTSAPASRGSGNNIERRMQPSAPQQQSGSRSSAFGGGRVFGAGGSHNAMQSSPASEARRETQPSVNHWPSQNNSTPRQFGGDAPSRRNESTGNRRVFGGNNDFSRNTGGGPVKVESRQYNNPGSNFGSAGNGGGSGRMPGRTPGNSGMGPGKNNGGGNFNAQSGNNNNGGPAAVQATILATTAPWRQQGLCSRTAAPRALWRLSQPWRLRPPSPRHQPQLSPWFLARSFCSTATTSIPPTLRQHLCSGSPLWLDTALWSSVD